MRLLPRVSDYGLRDPKFLELAAELAPELFAALFIAAHVGERMFPIKTLKGLADIFGEEGDAQVGGVHVTRAHVWTHVPEQFLPIMDRYELARKAYVLILGAHMQQAAEARAKLEAAGHKFDKDFASVRSLTPEKEVL